MKAARSGLPLIFGSDESGFLTSGFFLEGESGTGAARRTLGVAQGAHINLQFVDGSGKSIAMHTQVAGGTALISVAFLKNGDDESLLEFTDSFGIEDSAFVHLCYKRFKLILHGVSLFLI